MFTVLGTRERTGLEHCPLELQNVDPHFSDTSALSAHLVGDGPRETSAAAGKSGVRRGGAASFRTGPPTDVKCAAVFVSGVFNGAEARRRRHVRHHAQGKAGSTLDLFARSRRRFDFVPPSRGSFTSRRTCRKKRIASSECSAPSRRRSSSRGCSPSPSR